MKSMKDNTTAHPAAEYDKNIRKGIPCYDQFHEATISIVSAYLDAPTFWVDAGCGTGTFVEKAYGVFRTTKFVLADPSPAMLKLVKDKINGKDRAAILGPTTDEQATSERLYGRDKVL
jgi:tRNA (cmo5U34)-methyltransferase